MEPLGYESSALYRRLHTGHPTDVEIYCRIARQREGRTQRVIEIGCGWGRVLLPLASAGHDVTGLDVSASFLEECRAESQRLGLSTELHQVDVTERTWARALPAGLRFDLAILPYNTLYALGGFDRVVPCLEQVRDIMSARGQLWFDVYDADEFHAELSPQEPYEDDEEPVARFVDAGQEVEVFETTEIDPAALRLLVSYRARSAGSTDSMGELTMEHHYLLSSDIALALDLAGFELAARLPRCTLLDRWELRERHEASGEAADEAGQQIFYCALPRPRRRKHVGTR